VPHRFYCVLNFVTRGLRSPGFCLSDLGDSRSLLPAISSPPKDRPSEERTTVHCIAHGGEMAQLAPAKIVSGSPFHVRRASVSGIALAEDCHTKGVPKKTHRELHYPSLGRHSNYVLPVGTDFIHPKSTFGSAIVRLHRPSPTDTSRWRRTPGSMRAFRSELGPVSDCRRPNWSKLFQVFQTLKKWRLP